MAYHPLVIVVLLLPPCRYIGLGVDVLGAVGKQCLKPGQRLQVEGALIEPRGQRPDLTVREDTAEEEGS